MSSEGCLNSTCPEIDTNDKCDCYERHIRRVTQADVSKGKTKSKVKTPRAKDKFHPVDLAILGGDPSL